MCSLPLWLKVCLIHIHAINSLQFLYKFVYRISGIPLVLSARLHSKPYLDSLTSVVLQEI